MERFDRNPSSWLLLGTLLLVLSQLRFGIGVLAVVAPIPWLRYLRLNGSSGARLALLATGLVAWTLAVLKIVSAPMPPTAALGFGLPIGLALSAPFVGWDVIRRKAGDSVATWLFPALLVIAEWSLHGLLPFGTWGSLAHTQLHNLPLLQLASVTGLHGISFIVALVAVVAERVLAGERTSVRKLALGTATACLLVVALGQARLSLSTAAGLPTRRVAAVGTDSRVGTSPALPGPQRLREVERGLVARTELAAAGGADLVVWNEAATMVRPEGEDAFVERLRALAERLAIDLVAAYVVPLGEAPLRYENKYKFLRADGSVDHTYLKHEPVPGEPALRGEGPMGLVGRPGQGAVSGAICYDYDFPYLGLAHARIGADIVALPSSDWRGIDPIHTQMAALRAIEGGHSLVRSTRFGLSAIVDPWGRMRAWSSHFDGKRRVLIADVPRAGIQTLYGRLGDWFPMACLVFCLSACWLAVRRRAANVTDVLDSSDDGHGTVGGFEGRPRSV